RLEVLEQLLASLALGVDARNLGDPADPPITTLANDRSIRRHLSLHLQQSYGNPAGIPNAKALHRTIRVPLETSANSATIHRHVVNQHAFEQQCAASVWDHRVRGDCGVACGVSEDAGARGIGATCWRVRSESGG